jgi:hypothetical protein
MSRQRVYMRRRWPEACVLGGQVWARDKRRQGRRQRSGSSSARRVVWVRGRHSGLVVVVVLPKLRAVRVHERIMLRAKAYGGSIPGPRSPCWGRHLRATPLLHFGLRVKTLSCLDERRWCHWRRSLLGGVVS